MSGLVKATILMGAALIFLALPAWADSSVKGIAPPALYPPQTWQGRAQAVMRVLNRLDSHVEILTVPAGETGHYRGLSIDVKACLERPETLPFDAAVRLHLSDEQNESRPPFDGWMLAREPGLGVYASPLYDVQLVSCAGAKIHPDPGPLPQAKAPSYAPGAPAGTPEGDGRTESSGQPLSLLPSAAPSSAPSPAPSPGRPPLSSPEAPLPPPTPLGL